MELHQEIKLGSKASLSTLNHRQKRRPEDSDAVEDAWDRTFGKHCSECGHKHARHSPCKKGGAA